MRNINSSLNEKLMPGLRATHRGASLLEVLIAIVIMSFGLLALGGLTASSVQYGKMAQFQTVGIQFAADITERMRANKDGFLAGSYDRIVVYSSSAAASAAAPACVIPTKCSPAEIALMDMTEWRNNLRLSLPGGDALVRRDGATPAVDVWVMWMDPGLANGLANGGACPVAAIAVGATEIPRCLYFRIAI
jgi:type IV pilus assembly protein PilV